MTQPYLLLFDIDGTLLNTGGAGVRAMHRVASRLFGPSKRTLDLPTAGRLDPHIYRDLANHHGVDDHDAHAAAFHEHYLDELRLELAAEGQRSSTALPGIAPLLQQLRRRAIEPGDVVLGLLTGNFTQAAPLKLATAGIEVGWFSITAFGDEGATRPDLVALAMHRYQQQLTGPIQPTRVLVIGDTPHDIDCAKAHGCVAIGVATGQHTVAELRHHGADHVVPDFTNAGHLLKLLI